MLKLDRTAPKLLKATAVAFLVSFGASQGAHALVIDPAVTAIAASGPETSNAAIVAIVSPFVAPATELYKDNVGGIEEGSLTGSYETEYFDTPSDPSGAEITYVGGPIVSPNAWLVVKDGNQDPAWYLFDLTSLGWDGMEILELENFWPGRGAISHVSLYGGGGHVIPEPAALALAGSGLLGFGLIARRRRT